MWSSETSGFRCKVSQRLPQQIYSRRKENSEQPIDPHNAAFMELLDTIQPELEKAKAIGMDTALSRFQMFLVKYISKDEAMRYTRQKFKLKIV